LRPTFSLFAEYASPVTVLQHVSIKDDTATEVTSGGERTVHRVVNEVGRPAWLKADASLTKGGQVGLVTHC
jgi:hypothetical protein